MVLRWQFWAAIVEKYRLATLVRTGATAAFGIIIDRIFHAFPLGAATEWRQADDPHLSAHTTRQENIFTVNLKTLALNKDKSNHPAENKIKCLGAKNNSFSISVH